jgi:hypothetical protein
MLVFRTALGELVPATAPVDVPENEAGGRLGRHVLRTGDGRFVSPSSPAAAVSLSRSRARAEASGGTRAASSAFGVDTDQVVQGLAPESAGGSEDTGVQSAGAYRRRPGLQSTLGEVDEHAGVRHELPIWARRASGAPLVRSSDQREVFSALARAHTPEQVVQVIAEHGADLGSVPSTLPAPVIQVIEQVREGARQELEARFQAAREAAAGEGTGARSAPTPQKADDGSPQVLRAVRGLRKSRRTRSQSGMTDDRVMKLAKKLQSLIHLAEGTGDQNEARRHVRMAENSAAARQEGQGVAGAEAGASSRNAQVDIEALVGEVVRSVNNELSVRR